MTSTTRSLFQRRRLFGIGGALLLVICLATAIVSSAQTFTTIAALRLAYNDHPGAALAQATNGNFYGTTSGGCCVSGTVFKITPSGKVTSLHAFDGTDGAGLDARLVLATDGSIYGTTYSGGANNYGTVFKITPAGTLTTLYNFCSQTNCADGAYPVAGLTQATDGDLYGTTAGGNADSGFCSSGVCGTVFKMTLGGTLTTLYTFCPSGGPNCQDGYNPVAGLLQAANGDFYGTTSLGGANNCTGAGCGTLFKITRAGELTTLYQFCSEANCADGANPSSGLIQAEDGDLYGTTGAFGSLDPGTIYKVTQAGELTTLYRFCSKTNCADGIAPTSGLILATDANFYGVTLAGGIRVKRCFWGEGCGTVFKITPKGELTTLYSFSGYSDGAFPQGLLQSTNGTLYGTTGGYGAHRNGTVFSLSMGLGPFVAFVHDSGKVGWNAEILGQGFTGTTAVSFNGMPAAGFVVRRDTYLRATVPAGATTGYLTVTTPSGTLTSNVVYRVLPQIISFSPTSGPVGTPVTITGVSLTQTNKVAFGGVPATDFTVNSDTQVTATVPTGAKTGKIVIVTTGGRTWSTQVFTVQ